MYQVSLRAARVNAGFRQSDAAKLVNVDRTTLVRWEKGKTLPPADKLMTLCAAYKTPIDLIFLEKK